MVSLIFHGGHYKTGTTSLQHTLRHCEGALEASGVLFPRGPEDGEFSTAQQADLVTDSCLGKFDRVEAYVGQVLAVAKAKRCERVLFSSELVTSFHQFPEQFARWSEIAARHFDDVRYLFVVRDAQSFATSMYRELVKSGRASFHYDVVKDELAKQLTEQQRSIAFFRNWDVERTSFLSFNARKDGRLITDVVQALTGYTIDPAIEVHLNTSKKRAQNISALLLNDVYALIGAHRGQDALSVPVRKSVQANTHRGKLRRAFEEEFSAEIEEAFIAVTEKHVARTLEEKRPAVMASLEGLPAEIRGWLMPESAA